MSEFSNYLQNRIVDNTLRGEAMSPSADVYVALFTDDPGEDGSGTEVTTVVWPSYARQDTAAGGLLTAAWSNPVSGATANANEVTFPAYNPGDGTTPITITHMALYDAATAGNMLYYSALTTSKTLQPSDVLSFAVGNITVSVD